MESIKIVELKLPSSELISQIFVDRPMEKPPKLTPQQEQWLQKSHEVIKHMVKKGILKDNWPGQWDHIRREIEDSLRESR